MEVAPPAVGTATRLFTLGVIIFADSDLSERPGEGLESPRRENRHGFFSKKKDVRPLNVFGNVGPPFLR